MSVWNKIRWKIKCNVQCSYSDFGLVIQTSYYAWPYLDVLKSIQTINNTDLYSECRYKVCKVGKGRQIAHYFSSFKIISYNNTNQKSLLILYIEKSASRRVHLYNHHDIKHVYVTYGTNLDRLDRFVESCGLQVEKYNVSILVWHLIAENKSDIFKWDWKFMQFE